MVSLNMHKVCVTALMLMFAIVCCKPNDTEARRVIFYGPQKVLTSQILATQPKKEPCPKCQMRDHRNRCRRTISFNPDIEFACSNHIAIFQSFMVSIDHDFESRFSHVNVDACFATHVNKGNTTCVKNRIECKDELLMEYLQEDKC